MVVHMQGAKEERAIVTFGHGKRVPTVDTFQLRILRGRDVGVRATLIILIVTVVVVVVVAVLIIFVLSWMVGQS